MCLRFLLWLMAMRSLTAFVAPLHRQIVNRDSFLLAESEYIDDDDHEEDIIAEYQDFLPNPHPSLSAVDVVCACMDTLRQRKDAGLEVCFHFSSDRCRAANGGSLDAFVSYAQNPTFGYLLNCVEYQIESIGPIIPGTMHRGSMQTVLMLAKQKQISTSNPNDEDNDEKNGRRFLWTLQQERRPPLQGCWMIHEVLYTKNAIHQTW